MGYKKVIASVEGEQVKQVSNGKGLPVKASMLANGASYVPTGKKGKKVDNTDKVQEGIAMEAGEQVQHAEHAEQVSMPNNSTGDRVTDVLAGLAGTERDDIKQQVRMLLVKKGITLDKTLSRLAGMLDEEHERMKAKDKLALIEYLNVLHGVRARMHDVPEGQQVNQNLFVVQNMETSQVIGLLQEMNDKTQSYLSRLKERSVDYKQEE